MGAYHEETSNIRIVSLSPPPSSDWVNFKCCAKYGVIPFIILNIRLNEKFLWTS